MKGSQMIPSLAVFHKEQTAQKCFGLPETHVFTLPDEIKHYRSCKAKTYMGIAPLKASALILRKSHMLFYVLKERLYDPTASIPLNYFPCGKRWATAQQIIDAGLLAIAFVSEHDETHTAQPLAHRNDSLSAPYAGLTAYVLPSLLKDSSADCPCLQPLALVGQFAVLLQFRYKWNTKCLGKQFHIVLGCIPVVEHDIAWSYPFTNTPSDKSSGDFILGAVLLPGSLLMPQGISHGNTKESVAPQDHHQPLAQHVSAFGMVVIPIAALNLLASFMLNCRIIDDQIACASHPLHEGNKPQNNPEFLLPSLPQHPGEIVVRDSSQILCYPCCRLLCLKPNESAQVDRDAVHQCVGHPRGKAQHLQRGADQSKEGQGTEFYSHFYIAYRQGAGSMMNLFFLFAYTSHKAYFLVMFVWQLSLSQVVSLLFFLLHRYPDFQVRNSCF